MWQVTHQITQALPSLQMEKLSTIAIFALFAILLPDPRSCLALSTVPPALSNCRKCKIGTDKWPYAAWNCRARILRAQGRDKDEPRGSPPPPLHPPMNHP